MQGGSKTSEPLIDKHFLDFSHFLKKELLVGVTLRKEKNSLKSVLMGEPDLRAAPREIVQLVLDGADLSMETRLIMEHGHAERNYPPQDGVHLLYG